MQALKARVCEPLTYLPEIPPWGQFANQGFAQFLFSISGDRYPFLKTKKFSTNNVRPKCHAETEHDQPSKI